MSKSVYLCIIYSFILKTSLIVLINFLSKIDSLCSMSLQMLKVNTKREGFQLKAKSNIRTLDSPTLMLQLSQTLNQIKNSNT